MNETKVTSIRLNEDYKNMINEIRKDMFPEDMFTKDMITETDIIKACITYTYHSKIILKTDLSK